MTWDLSEARPDSMKLSASCSILLNYSSIFRYDLPIYAEMIGLSVSLSASRL
jgi:hypothetical protein